MRQATYHFKRKRRKNGEKYRTQVKTRTCNISIDIKAHTIDIVGTYYDSSFLYVVNKSIIIIACNMITM